MNVIYRMVLFSKQRMTGNTKMADRGKRRIDQWQRLNETTKMAADRGTRRIDQWQRINGTTKMAADRGNTSYWPMAAHKRDYKDGGGPGEHVVLTNGSA